LAFLPINPVERALSAEQDRVRAADLVAG